ncbi:MAG: hypothetical protein MZW92_70020 [Comamonadaceae bacterium]|nr:hypothetical protein [Comamonadaceae bacterium]
MLRRTLQRRRPRPGRCPGATATASAAARAATGGQRAADDADAAAARRPVARRAELAIGRAACRRLARGRQTRRAPRWTRRRRIRGDNAAVCCSGKSDSSTSGPRPPCDTGTHQRPDLTRKDCTQVAHASSRRRWPAGRACRAGMPRVAAWHRVPRAAATLAGDA